MQLNAAVLVLKFFFIFSLVRSQRRERDYLLVIKDNSLDMDSNNARVHCESIGNALQSTIFIGRRLSGISHLTLVVTDKAWKAKTVKITALKVTPSSWWPDEIELNAKNQSSFCQNARWVSWDQSREKCNSMLQERLHQEGRRKGYFIMKALSSITQRGTTLG